MTDDKKETWQYQCFKCGKYFEKDRDLDTDKPCCDECFKKLIAINNADDYFRFMGEK